MRELMKEGVASSVLSTDRSIQYLFDIMEKEGPFEGIIGYSEGATVAGTLLLAEQMRAEKLGREPMIKCAIFFAGWPPLDPTTYAMVLSDESDLMINIHTCHISESNRPCWVDQSTNDRSWFARPLRRRVVGTLQRM